MGITEKEVERLQKIVYPYVGISGKGAVLNQIILFTGPRTGINLNGKGWPMGKSTEGWDEESFIPYYGSISYSNGRVAKSDDKEISVSNWEVKKVVSDD